MVELCCKILNSSEMDYQTKSEQLTDTISEVKTLEQWERGRVKPLATLFGCSKKSLAIFKMTVH